MVPMKLSELFLLSLIFISFFLFNNCEDVTDPADECEKTKWQEVKEPTINLIGSISVTQDLVPNSPQKMIDTALYIETTGSIQKYYCDGTPSGKFDFSTNYYPDLAPDSLVWYDIKIGQAYQFKFQNDADHVKVNLKWKLYFNHGLIYESKIFVKDFYYKDITYSNYWLSHIIYWDCYGFNWVKVGG